MVAKRKRIYRSVKRPSLSQVDLGRPGDAEKMRKCLRCSEEFPSTWAGNRLCDRCRLSAAKISDKNDLEFDP